MMKNNPNSSFEAIIQDVTKENILGLPDLSSLVRHDEKATRPKMNILEDSSYRLTANNRATSDESFINKDLLSFGKDDSRHQVFFGGVTSVDGEVRDIAVKQHTLDMALGEIAMMQYASNLGLWTFPIDSLYVSRANVSDSRNRQSWFLTRFVPGVDTMDTLRWSDMDDTDKIHQIQIAAAAVASFHKHHLQHGDSSLRNIVRNRDEAHMIDLEHAVSFKNASEIASSMQLTEASEKAQETINRKVRTDLWHLRKDTYDKVLNKMTNEAKNTWWSKNIMDFYVSTIETAQHDRVLSSAGKIASQWFTREDL